MAHILTDTEALGALRETATTDIPIFDMLMNGVDEELKTTTGHDWSSDGTVDPDAKIAAMMLIISLRDGTTTSEAYRYKVTQLDAKAKEMSESG